MPQKEISMSETVELMLSANYKDRVKAEYHQLRNRYNKLRTYVESLSERNDVLTCQLVYMQRYMVTLECRAELEGIDL